MRITLISLLSILFFHPVSCQTKSSVKPQDLSALTANLKRQKSHEAYDALHFYLVEHYTEMSPDQRSDVRKALQQHAIWSSQNLCPAGEPGTRITLHGHLSDPSGKPLSGAHLHVFQADHLGYYAPTDASTGKMAEHDPRLEGFIITDAAGNFELNSIRPASYPQKYQGRMIPQHVHIVANAAGYQEGAFQVVFEDDPAMSEYWVEWAHKRQFPIVQLKAEGAVFSGNLDITLAPK